MEHGDTPYMRKIDLTKSVVTPPILYWRNVSDEEEERRGRERMGEERKIREGKGGSRAGKRERSFLFDPS